MYLNSPMTTRIARITRSLLRHPRKSREFPARKERLVTAQDLAHLGW